MRRTRQRVTVSMDLASLDTPGLVSFARGVGKGFTDNVNLTDTDIVKMPVSTVDLLASATALETLHTQRLSAPSPASTKLESDRATTLMEQLTNLAAFAEWIANTKAAGNVAVSGAILVSFGFQLKKEAVRHSKGFEGSSPEKGTARLHVPRGADNEVRLVQYSSDGGKTWSLPIVVHGVYISFTGLQSGTAYLFQIATSTPPQKGKQMVTAGSEALQWGDAISCLIL